MPETNTGTINVFNSLAVLLKGLGDSLEGAATTRSPLPRWVRIARVRPYQTATIGGIVKTGTVALVNGIKSMQDLTYKAEEYLLQGDGLVALGDVALDVVKEVSKPEFQDALTTGIGIDSGSLSALNALNQPLTTVQEWMNKVPTEEDLWQVKTQLARLLKVAHTAEGKIDLENSGKIRLLEWAYLAETNQAGALGVRSLTATPLEANPKGIYQLTAQNGAVISVEVLSVNFATGTQDRDAAMTLLASPDLNYGTDIKGFQTACGFEEAAQTNVLDVRTINALLGIDTKANMIFKPKKKS